MRKLAVLTLFPLVFTAACGGGGGGSLSGGGQTITPPGPPNVETLTVNSGPAGVNALNTPYISVTLCQPGNANNCQTIDYIEVDTGSTGLRILYGALNTSLFNALTTVNAGTGFPMSECLQFVIGSNYGSVKVGDITLPVSGEKASNVTLQVIGDPAYVGNVPPDCTGMQENDVMSFGANGIIGVGALAQDCGPTCTTVNNQNFAWYYSCQTPTTCVGTTVPLTNQLLNPVTLFAANSGATDNNGVIVELPPVSANGAASVSGSLVFGIGTRANNGLGSATVLTADPLAGVFGAKYPVGSTTYPAILDTGSDANYFNSNLPVCAANTSGNGFFCPASTTNQSATLEGTTSGTLTANFQVVNATNTFNQNLNSFAFAGIGAPNTMVFDLGLPYFYGINVFVAIEGEMAPGGTTPYYAY